jgi:MFS family permease
VQLPLPITFVVAAASLILVFAVAGAPIPLYNLYVAQDGITHGDLGLIAVGYFVAAAASLLLLGRLSNHLGRKRVAITALACAAMSCVILAVARGVPALMSARILQGLGAGLASTALGAYVVDSAPTRPRWLAALVTGSAPMVGVPLGALASGALADYGPAPRTLVYEILVMILAASVVLMTISPETRVRSAGAMRSLRPRLNVPAGSRRILVACAAAFVATWSIGGFYQAFGPSVVAEDLGASSALVAAAVFSSIMVLNPLGGPIAGRLAPATAMRAGMFLFLLALGGIVASLHAGVVVPFIAASLVVGIAQGMASTGGIQALLSGLPADDRAGLLSMIYLISYCGAAIPAMVAGKLAATWTLFHIALAYVALGFVAALVTMFTAKKS